MPGLTGDILLEEADKMGLFLNGQMTNLSADQWDRLETACQERLHLPPDWNEEMIATSIRRAKMDGWGTKYGPPLHGQLVSIRKKDLREDKKVVRKQPTVIINDGQEKLW